MTRVGPIASNLDESEPVEPAESEPVENIAQLSVTGKIR